MSHQKSTTISYDFKNQLEQLIKTHERLTGKQYQITVNEYGYFLNQGIIVGSFEQRNKYIIENMSDKYIELEGTYDSLEDIKSTVKKLKLKDFEAACSPSRWDYIDACVLSGTIFVDDSGSISGPNSIGSIRFE